MYDFTELTALFETDVINVKVTMEYAPGQSKTVTIPVATLTWLEWLEATRAIPAPAIPTTEFDEKTNSKIANPKDPDYIKAVEITAWRRNAYRVVKALEKAGAVFNGSTNEKIEQAMNKSGVFFALHKVVEGTTERVFAKVDDLSDSFRGEQNNKPDTQDVPVMEADAVAV